MIPKTTAFVLSTILLILLLSPTSAQGPDTPWSTPTNLSASGSASSPSIAVSPDGMIHVLWWDTFDGTQYAYSTTDSWVSQITVPQIVASRKVNEQTGDVTITPPTGLRMASDAQSYVYALWYDSEGQLVGAQTRGGRAWSEAGVLAGAALAYDVAASPDSGMHMAYVRPVSTDAFPSGIYYRPGGGGVWDGLSQVYASPYFRTASADEAHVSVAGNNGGQVLIAWDDPHRGASLLARSENGGTSWSEPQVVSATVGMARGARVAAAADGGFLLLWQDAAAGGACGLSQARSTDGGATWGPPERALTALTSCPAQWQFSTGADGRLWLVGTPGGSDAAAGATVLAAWDGTAWSEPAGVGLSFRDAATERTISLGCLGAAVAGAGAGLAGCDSSGDVWAARNAVDLSTLIPALVPVWSAPVTLSDGTGPAGLPALAADGEGKLYAMWSQGDPGKALYAAIWDGTRWSRGVSVLAADEGKAEQPALSIDAAGRAHVVLSAGKTGSIYYAWTYARDLTYAQGWSDPAVLPAPSALNSAPDIVADPRGEVLHVVYAVPYNEKRGIYYVTSTDAGATWSDPATVYDAVAAGADSADRPRLALDAGAGVLHAAWLQATAPGVIGTQAVLYARSSDGGATWSEPVKIAEGDVDWPRIAVARAGELHVVWNQSRTAGTSEVWDRYSPDGGERWSEGIPVSGLGDVMGPAGLATDGAGALYLGAVGQGNTGDALLLVARWDGAGWGAAEQSSLLQDAAAGDAAALALGPGAARLGAVLRASVRGADVTMQFSALTTGRDVAPVPVTPAPAFTPLPTNTPAPTATPLPTATPKPEVGVSDPPEKIETGVTAGLDTIAVAGGLAGVLVAGVAVWWGVWGRRR